MRRHSAGHRYTKPVLAKKLALEAVQYCISFANSGDHTGLLVSSIDFIPEIRNMIIDNIPAHLKIRNDYGGRIVFDNGAEMRIFLKHNSNLAKSLMGGEIFIANTDIGDPRLRMVEDIILS